MPRKRNAATNNNKQAAVGTRRSTRQNASRASKEEQDVPEVFQDMLIEAYHNNPDDFVPDPRPAKRRKVDVHIEKSSPPADKTDIQESSPAPQPTALSRSATPHATPVRPQQVIFNNDFSDEDDSDVSFEDVQISRGGSPEEGAENGQAETKSLNIDLSAPTTSAKPKTPQRAKVKPLTKAERDHRLDVHKWHLLCLLLHAQTINQWCDNETVQKNLKRLVSKKIINQLHLPETRTQAERKFSFDNAITEICHIWKLAFKITSHGARKAQWRDKIDMEAEMESAPDPIDLEDFQTASRICSGSRDLGAQLFCALLRSLAVDSRLVCSLQVLPFARATSSSTPQKPPMAYINADAQDFGTTPSTSRGKKKKIKDSPFPIWWIEVFSPAITDWVPLDPLVRNTINKPRTGFEPPASDPLNNMSYVVAFEEDGSAKDVTRRYVSHYNAKTRRGRIEVTKGGTEWYSATMRYFAKSSQHREDRDEIEDAALNRRLAQEGMPKNVQDFKDHPVYVLERHLRNNEVIEPRRECGKFSVGTGKNQRLESVFRRENVHACRSAEGWYRKGRDIQPGEQPLKRAIPRKKRTTSLRLEDEDGDEDGENDGVPLYAEYQTEIYIPPPIVDGQVPRNGYGNLDVYVASMIPAGGVHVRHSLASQASKVLKIDAADAVTGFVFKGRQGTAVVDGVVVDARYTGAMLGIIAGLEDQLEDEVNAQREAILTSVWKKMHAVLRVRQRLQEEYGERAGIDLTTKDDASDDDPDYEDDGGGFMPEVQGKATKESRAEEAENMSMLRDRAPIVLPLVVSKRAPIVVRSPHALPQPATFEGQSDQEDLFGDDEVEAGGFVLEEPNNADAAGGFMVEDVVDGSDANCGEDREGGFLPEVDDQAGGFVVEEDTQGGFVIGDDTDTDAPRSKASADPSSVKDLSQGALHKELTTNDRPGSPKPHVAEQLVKQPSQTEISNTSVLTSQGSSKKGKGKQSKSSRPDRLDGTAEAAKRETEVFNTDSPLSENSLPSHDPEEDDLEPQWVEDAFEDF